MAALLTFLGDALKGSLTVGLAQYFGLSQLMVAFVAIATLIGHIFPIYYSFKGGKGVATAVGILFLFSWAAALTLLAIWLVVFLIWGYSSLAAIISVILSPVIGYFFGIKSFKLMALFVFALMITFRHIDNIKRLINGEELKIKN
jgi:glycerol-3-phosphate acyltransferase PlsY